MADVKWMKLSLGLLENQKIKQICSLPEGDILLAIWLQILCLAGQMNDNGLVYFSKDIPYTEEMLATEFDRPLITIRLALRAFEAFGMVAVVDSILLVSNWEKYLRDTPKEACVGNEKKPADIFSGYAFSDAMKAQLEKWLTYKKERRESYKPTGLKSFLTQMQNKLAQHGEPAVISLMEHCMSQNWKGIIWDKLDSPAKAPPKQRDYSCGDGESL